MARKGSKTSGRLATSLAFRMAGVGLLCGALVTVGIANFGDGKPKQAWITGFAVTGVATFVAGAIGFMVGGKLGARVTDVGLAVSKLGRGAGEVRVRSAGNDEIGALGKAVQYLANDLQQQLQEQEQAGGGQHVSADPQVKQLRDRTVPEQVPQVAGYEIDAQLSAGSRGGLDYFDVVSATGETPQTVAYVVSAEGHGAIAVHACKLARDELHRALLQGATPRKALAHTNKVCKTNLPTGCCAKATLLQISADGCKLYQAGARMPLLICQRGEVLELHAEGIAIGLDDGPVFEKSLRPQEIAMSPGVRLVLGNEALQRTEGMLDLLREHSSRHTRMFMNVVLGTMEQEAGDDGLREDVVLITVKKAADE